MVRAVIAVPGQSAELVRTAAGSVIGADAGFQRPVATVTVPPGALLCFYTDALVERRGQVLDVGQTRALPDGIGAAPEAACAAVMGALIGSEPARDDIALLMIRRQSSPDPPGAPRRRHSLD